MEPPLTKGIADRLRGGEPKAIETVVDAFHASVYRFLLCRCSTAAQAEELTAETFFQVLKSISTFRGNDHQIRAFVFTTARHVRANSYRSRSRNATTTDSTATIADRQESPLERLLAKERIAGVAKAIAQLGDTAREVIVLSFVEGDSP